MHYEGLYALVGWLMYVEATNLLTSILNQKVYFRENLVCENSSRAIH